MSEVELMPNLYGITSYFDISSVDLTSNKWLNRVDTNLVDKYNMDLPNGGTIQNNALYLTAAQYGQLKMTTEPQTIYCVFKATLKNVWSPIISKQMTTTTSGYGFWITLNTSNYITMTSSSNDKVSSVKGDGYHVVCITKSGTTGYLYIDGVFIGTITAKSGYYGGNCYINRLYRGSGFADTPTDVEFRMCAFGTIYHDENTVKTNTTFLLNGVKPKNSRLAGTDAVAIAYAIARNQESAAALQEMKKAFKDGVHEGNDTVVDKTEPIPNDDDEIVIAGGDDDTFPAEFERGGIYIKTKEITVTDDNGNEVTGVFQLNIGLDEMTSSYYPAVGRYNWGYNPKVTLTGNGINKTQTFGTAWKGSTSASAPGVKDGNEFWMTEAKIYKSSAKFGGTYYWEYSGGYSSRSWTLSGDFATALRAGAYVGTLPFDDVI